MNDDGHTPEDLPAALEAVLMVAAEPLDPAELARALDVSEDTVVSTLQDLAADYDGAHGRPRGFELRSTAGRWRIYSRASQHEHVARVLTAGRSASLSQAALETLAIIAYEQPVTRAGVAAIRGVNVDSVVRTLQMHGLVTTAETADDSHVAHYVTTPAFLEAVGLDGLGELPDIAPYLPSDADAEID